MSDKFRYSILVDLTAKEIAAIKEGDKFTIACSKVSNGWLNNKFFDVVRDTEGGKMKRLTMVIDWHGQPVATHSNETAQDLDDRLAACVSRFAREGFALTAISVKGLPSFELETPAGKLSVNPKVKVSELVEQTETEEKK